MKSPLLLLLAFFVALSAAVNVPIKREVATGTVAFTLPDAIYKIDGKMARPVAAILNMVTTTLNNAQTQGYAEGTMAVSQSASLVGINVAGTAYSLLRSNANGQLFLAAMQTLDWTLQVFSNALGKY